MTSILIPFFRKKDHCYDIDTRTILFLFRISFVYSKDFGKNGKERQEIATWARFCFTSKEREGFCNLYGLSSIYVTLSWMEKGSCLLQTVWCLVDIVNVQTYARLSYFVDVVILEKYLSKVLFSKLKYPDGDWCCVAFRWGIY